MSALETIGLRKFVLPDIKILYAENSENNSTFKPKQRKFKFNYEDDQRLIVLVKKYTSADNTYIDWNQIAQEMGNRTPRQCKERWMFYLSPEVNNGPFTKEEDKILMEKYNELGSKWSTISQNFKNRTPTCIKNRVLYILRTNKRNEELNKKSKVPMMHIQDLISLIPYNQQRTIPLNGMYIPLLPSHSYIPNIV